MTQEQMRTKYYHNNNELYLIDILRQNFNPLRMKMLSFFSSIGDVERFITSEFSDSQIDIARSIADERSAYTSNISKKTADILFSSIWTNNNETIDIPNIKPEDRDQFIELLNKTNFCETLYKFVKDIVDIGVAYIYVEELKQAPYLNFYLVNPINMIYYHDTYYYFWRCNKTKKENIYDNDVVEFNTTVLSKKESYSYDHSGRKVQTSMKYDNIISFIDGESSLSAKGAGITALGAIKSTDDAVAYLNDHVEKVVDPPLIVNSTMVPDDNMVNLEPGGVTRAEAKSEGGTPVANALGSYASIVPQLMQLVQFSSAEIEKSYMLDMLVSQDQSIRMSTYQTMKQSLYNKIIPTLLNTAAKVLKKKKQFDYSVDELNITYKSMFLSLGETTSLNNFNTFLATFENIEKITGGQGEQLNPFTAMDYLVNILGIRKEILMDKKVVQQQYQQQGQMLQQQLQSRQQQGGQQQ